MKRILKAAAAFLPFVLLIVCVNWYADPANVLRTGYEKNVAQIMVQGENAGNLRNMDDRAFMKSYAELRTQPIGTLALGSSHSMQITKELTGDPDTFCAGVTGADLRDCISIYRLLREKGFAPKRVILTVDPWFLSEGTLEGRAMTEGYEEFCEEHGLHPYESNRWSRVKNTLEKKGQAFSIPYFQSSLDYLKKGLQHTRDAVATTQHDAQSALRRADGSYSYEGFYREAGVEEVRGRAQNLVIAKPDFASHFTGVSEELAKQLDVFLGELESDGASAAVMIAPFHPVYYDHMTKQTDNYVELLATEDLIRTIAAGHEMPVFGSYSPYVCNLTEADFYDGLHCSESAMYRFYPEDLFS